MNNSLKTGIAIFVCVCLGVIAYTQWDKHQAEKKAEAEIKTQTQQMIDKIDEHQKQGNPLENRKKGTL